MLPRRDSFHQELDSLTNNYEEWHLRYMFL